MEGVILITNKSLSPSPCLRLYTCDQYVELTLLPKIFDEIIVNAADNKQRDANMDKMEVVIDSTRGVISVLNNGKGIPVVKHKEHKCYVPTLIFGQLLTVRI